MKTILATAYAVNPYKGSEDGTGWNFIYQIALKNKVIAITRKNNREDIERFFNSNADPVLHNIECYYYDLPYWMRFWKRGGKGSTIYFYLWQLFMPLFVLWNALKFDIAHNINFHSDSHPSFLWVLGKPFIWGPVGHHPPIPKEYILPIYGRKAYIKDRLYYFVKTVFRKFDPFYSLSVRKAHRIIAINSSVQKVCGAKPEKVVVMPAVSSENVPFKRIKKEGFHVISVGRFVPMKAFELSIMAFSKFYKNLALSDQKKCTLSLIGKGPQKDFLKKLVRIHELEEVVRFIDWVPREKMNEMYRNASAFLFPSHEGAGMVIPEALSYALPVLCFDNVGPGELVSRQASFKIPYSNYLQSVNQFAYALKTLYKNPDLQEEMENAAKAHFDNHFLWSKKGALIEEIYNSCVTKQNEKSTVVSLDYSKEISQEVLLLKEHYGA